MPGVLKFHVDGIIPELMPPAPPNFIATPPAPQLEIWPNYRPPLVGHLRSSALYCTSSALSSVETPRFSRNCVESTIVGYASSDLDATGGAVAIAPQFTLIGSQTGIKLKDIVPSTETGTSLRRKIQIQLLTPLGDVSTFYRWEGQNGKTWIAGTSTADVGETIIPNGQGLWVLNTANCATTFQTSGAVGTSDIIQPLDAEGGAVMVGNTFPVSVKLKDIVPSTETGTSLRRKIQIQLLTPLGDVSTFYRWEGQNGKTWIAGSSTADMGETEIPAGQGMWVLNTANCAVTMRIPSPEL